MAVNSKIVRDPICGMPVDPEKTQYKYESVSFAETYYFCSEDCMKSFIENPRIAYFTMEVGITSEIPTYSGGLGVLAGDTIKSSADLKVPLVAVTLVSRKGYVKQTITDEGWQLDYPDEWDPSKILKLLPNTIKIKMGGRDVMVQAWLYEHQSPTGGVVPILFLDTDVEGNALEDREITDRLYGGDDRYRLKQEIVLGIGGVRLLRGLFFKVKKYHMNEGHSSLLTLELLKDNNMDFEKVRNLCIFTTHTPVEAAFDRFSYEIVQELLNDEFPIEALKHYGGQDFLNAAVLASDLSRFVNGVTKAHVEFSRKLFPGHYIRSVTNGVHSYTWTCSAFRELFDRYIPGWANEPILLVRATEIPNEEIWDAHVKAKMNLIDFIEKRKGLRMDAETLTIGFARRATEYKRATLLFSDLKKLIEINKRGGMQLVFAGKAHPRDEGGKRMISEIYSYIDQLENVMKIVYLENYDMDMSAKLTSGVDVWLNTPLPPFEASGTSGMKAAHNGVVNFGILDGWWIEGCIEGVTGWAIGPEPNGPVDEEERRKEELEDLYNKLEYLIIPTFYNKKDGWITMMKNSIGKVAYYFNTNRMMRRYATDAYLT